MKRTQMMFALLIVMIVGVLSLGCGSPAGAQTKNIDYTPQAEGDWMVSTPEAQGMDAALIDRLYSNAESVETIESLLVIKNGYLISEKYYGSGGIDHFARLQSVTKSFTATLAGIAVDQGAIDSVDAKVMDYFPELRSRLDDGRKLDITLEQMLQMRAGLPWEESSTELFEMLYAGFRPSYFMKAPLKREPGTAMEYSNLTAHMIGVTVARATGTDLLTFGNTYLFGPMNIEIENWIQDWEGNYNGHGDIFMRARDMAKLGQLYLDDGMYNGEQLLSSEWIDAAWQNYSKRVWPYRIGKNVKDMSYGYQWWSYRSGDYTCHLAWGHGGQQIAVVEELDLVVVVTADPQFGNHGDQSWKQEKQNLNLVADFIKTLP